MTYDQCHGHTSNSHSIPLAMIDLMILIFLEVFKKKVIGPI